MQVTQAASTNADTQGGGVSGVTGSSSSTAVGSVPPQAAVVSDAGNSSAATLPTGASATAGVASGGVVGGYSTRSKM